MPPSARYAYMALGLAWLVFGWVGGWAFWASVVVIAAIGGLLVGGTST